MTEQERLGISDGTMQSMKEFFMKHSVPKLIELKENDPEAYERLEQEVKNERLHQK